MANQNQYVRINEGAGSTSNIIKERDKVQSIFQKKHFGTDQIKMPASKVHYNSELQSFIFIKRHVNNRDLKCTGKI